MKGRKLHALVDVEGLPLRVIVHSAGIQDRDRATLVLDKIRRRFPWLELFWADAGYNARRSKTPSRDRRGSGSESSGARTTQKASSCYPVDGSSSEPFPGSAATVAFAKDYENLADTLAAFVTLAAIQFAIRRLARP